MGSQPRSIVILGSTGSIGTQTLDVVRRMGGRIRVVGLAAHRNAEQLLAQAEEFGVKHVCLADPAALSEVSALSGDLHVHVGQDGMDALASLPEADTVVVAVAGAIGIAPTHAAIRARKRIALASKEVLVAAGGPTMALAREYGVEIVPIDSEHSALFQCLHGNPREHVDTLILTASGGPFREHTIEQMHGVTPEDALRHPTWDMGGLVTINSATLMNKGLEIIEARWLFDVPEDRIEVIIHPQSIIHSLVRFRDGSVLAQMGLPDMRLPIQYALLYPDRVDTGLPRLDLANTAHLTFAEPDPDRFPALTLARHAIAAGGTMPAVMNGANEAAVARFLERDIPFLGIMKTVEAVMSRHRPQEPSLPHILEADRWAREQARLY